MARHRKRRFNIGKWAKAHPRAMARARKKAHRSHSRSRKGTAEFHLSREQALAPMSVALHAPGGVKGWMAKVFGTIFKVLGNHETRIRALERKV